ncbi:ChaN family lipoprotein [Sneathiella glossodoripedis]|uniref:ChaN family lipoprotein n=1 Tax=Sneathiella glossodoripedis TaxID=418853 RepID=UPI0004727D6D|nr:ChaN family lipoprotein [Sneathiella glossodoripedis]
MNRLALTSFVGLFLLGVAGCAPRATDDTASISDVAANTNINSRIQEADYVLLGEKHDHPLHHEIQAKLLKHHLKSGDLVVFEMLNRDQQSVIDQYLSDQIPFEELPQKLRWELSGWPDWSYYAPLFEAAKSSSAKILYGSYPKAELMQVSKQSAPHENPLSDMQMEDLDKQIRQSHCQMLPENMVRPMSNIQIVKDRLMAAQLQKKEKNAKAFLIAGNGHIRKDRGVPLHLQQNAQSNIFALGLIEEQAEPAEWELYSEYDAIWVVGSLGKTMEDYCQSLKERFGNKSS